MARGRTPGALASEWERAEALAVAVGHPGLAAALARLAARRERALLEELARSGEPVEHGGRLYRVGLDGELIVTVPEEDE